MTRQVPEYPPAPAHPAPGLSTADWLSMAHQRLAEVTQGPVFRDGPGMLTRVRSELAWYPEQVWLYVLASQWQRISQEEPFVGRTSEADDELGSRIVAARLTRDLVRLWFLLEQRYPPYSKWLGTAFSRLASADDVGPAVERALDAKSYPEREAALGLAYRLAGQRQNALAIAPNVDPEPQPFYSRPFLVSAAGSSLQCAGRAWTTHGCGHARSSAASTSSPTPTDLLSRPRATFGVATALFNDEELAGALLAKEDQA